MGPLLEPFLEARYRGMLVCWQAIVQDPRPLFGHVFLVASRALDLVSRSVPVGQKQAGWPDVGEYQLATLMVPSWEVFLEVN